MELHQLPAALFVTGIDTDAGKSYATGWLAKQLRETGLNVITQKFVQTGNHDFSEDIQVHRDIMGTGLLPDDISHLTAPIIFSYPASPDLAAKIDNRVLDLSVAAEATAKLSEKFDIVLVEGAGGLMVPLDGDYLTIDYVKQQELSLILVTNGRLGSVSHTLLALHAIKTRGINLFATIYNRHFDTDEVISSNTRSYLRDYVERHFPDTLWIESPSVIK